MKISYTFNSDGMCESAQITHAHSSEQIIQRAYPYADLSVTYGPGVAYSVNSDDKKVSIAVCDLMRKSYRYVFDYKPLPSMLGQLHNYAGSPA